MINKVDLAINKAYIMLAMLESNNLEHEISVLEKNTEELIYAYNTLLARYTSLKTDYSNLDRDQEIQRAKLATAKSKLTNLMNKLKSIEENHE
ncbi:MAG: hypothetical protein HRT87_01100 [Legionellales bacterium]|nr:hypothetical protein [Legionellales bacterium]